MGARVGVARWVDVSRQGRQASGGRRKSRLGSLRPSVDDPFSFANPQPLVISGSMDYDPFEIHMQLLALLRRLSASHQSIDNVVAFLVRYRDKCADDLWECVTDECQKVRPTPSRSRLEPRSRHSRVRGMVTDELT